MISGATRGAGGRALGRHLATSAKNEVVKEMQGRGLIAEGIQAQIAELTWLGSHARTRTPLYHIHVDPPADRPWTPTERDAYWSLFEAEFGLEDRPFAAVEHLKGDRTHEHRVYLRVKKDGRAVRLDHDFARREKLGRVFEFDRGDGLTPGAHNRGVAAALEREGRADVAAAMLNGGLIAVRRPRAALTPKERHQQERSCVDKDTVRKDALAAWRSADSGTALEAALAGHGLRLARGDDTAQLVDASGATHDLRRTLAMAAKADGGKITAEAIRSRVAGLALPTVDGARKAIQDAVPAHETVSRSDETPSHVLTPTTPSKENSHAAARPEAEDICLDPAPSCADASVSVERPPDFGHDIGDLERHENPGRAQLDGQPRDVADDLRSVARGESQRGPAAVTRLASAAGEEGGDPNRPDPRPARENRREPSPAGIEARRRRIETRRAVQRLAAAGGKRSDRLAALIARLAPPAERLRAALKESDQLAAEVLADEPWRNPATRSAHRIACDLHDERITRSRQADTAAAAAKAAAEATRGKLNVFDRIANAFGLRTAALVALQEAEAFAEEANSAQRSDSRDVREDLARVDRQAAAIVIRREADHKRWTQRPNITNALKEQRGNNLVETALASADPEVSALAATGDLAGARELVLKRELEKEEKHRRATEAARRGAEAQSADSEPQAVVADTSAPPHAPGR